VTTANKITILRILLVPFFIVQVLYYMEGGLEYHRLLAVLAFAVAAISDAVDGYIARHYNQRSELGAFLDPLADKLLLVSGIVLLSLANAYLERLPLWLGATVISRDVLLLIGVLVLRYIGISISVRPVMVGKAATVLQMACVIWALLKWDNRWLLVWAAGAAICTAISGVIYILQGVAQMSASPSSSATSKQ
jgi:CDP-diacylglycerol--glycerol-3-phosphate 3-phosphatidyltransferase